MNRRQKFFLNFIATVFVTFIISFFANSWCLVRAFQDFFQAGQKVELTALVYEGVSESEIQEFIQKYQKNSEITEIKRQTAEEAFQNLKAELKLFDFQITAGDLEKVLPQVITMKLSRFDSELLNEMKTSKVVDELLDGKHWMQKNENIINVLKGSGVTLSLICLSAFMLSLLLLLKTQMQFERDELALRAMHGETLWSLRKAYVIKGFMISFGGTFLGIASTFIGSEILRKKILVQFQIQSLAEQIQPMTWQSGLTIVLAISVVGMAVSYIQTTGFKREFFLQR